MKNIISIILLALAFSASSQRVYVVTADTLTGKYKFRVDETVTDGGNVRGGYTITEYNDTAAVTAAIKDRYAKYIQAVTEAQAILTAVTSERDSLAKLLDTWWDFYGMQDFAIMQRAKAKPKSPTAPIETPKTKPPKKSKATKPKKGKQ